MPPLEFAQHRARRDLGCGLAGVDGELLASVSAGGARYRRAIARADERLEAGKRRLGRILASKFNLLTDLVADRDGEFLERALHLMRAIDALGDGDREFLRLLLVGERLHQVRPARLLGYLVHRPVDALVDDVVEAAAAPCVTDNRAVVDVGDAGFECAHGNRLDGRAERRLIACLTGLVVGLR